MEQFRKRLSEVLKSNGTNQSELARNLNIERQGITNYKNGNSIPSLDTFKNLCIKLDVSADYLLGLSEYDDIRKENYHTQPKYGNSSFNVSIHNNNGVVHNEYKPK